MNQDIKFKDALPENTVARIQGILAAHGIETAEDAIPSGVRHCHSMRVSVKDVNFGANGKGMTEAYSLASGYAEFMERLQAGYLRRRIWRDQMLDFPDEKQMTPDAVGASCAKWLEDMRRGCSAELGRQLSPVQIWQKVFEADGDAETVAALPFYEPRTGETVWFPKKAMAFLYNTNGLAAGNNLVEAAVQSLSEIYERHNLVRIFFGDFVPPTIPDEYLRGFPKVYEIIEELREAGLKVLVKDCSLGEPFPLCAAVVIDETNHAYHVHLGAFPDFSIALERSFTEMFQGRTLRNVTDVQSVVAGDSKRRSNAELIDFLTNGCGRYPLSFFSEEATYPFRPFPDRSDRSNAELLTEYLDYLEGKGCSVYLRDISYLGFPSIRVVVPGMSEIMPTLLADRFPIAWMLERHEKTPLHLMDLNPEERGEYRQLLDYLLRNYGLKACNYVFLTGRSLDRNSHNVSRFLGFMVYAWLEWERRPAEALRIAKGAIPLAKPESAGYLACLLAFREQLEAGADRKLIRSAFSVLYGEKTAAEVDAVLAAGENPFARFLIRCTPELCERCPYHESCSGWTSAAFIEKIRGIVAQFDAEASHKQLRETFAGL